MAQFIASVIFKKKTTDYTIRRDADGNIDGLGDLCLQLHKMVDAGEICKAEDLLFQAIDKEQSTDCLELAVDFYGYLNTFEDKFLNDNDFSREEVAQGIEDIQRIYGIVNPT